MDKFDLTEEGCGGIRMAIDVAAQHFERHAGAITLVSRIIEPLHRKWQCNRQNSFAQTCHSEVASSRTLPLALA